MLGNSSEANNSVRKMLLPEDVSSQQLLQAGDVRPLSPEEGVFSQDPLHMNDVRVRKTDKISVVENSSLLKEGKLPFLEKFEKLSCISRFLFPGPKFIVLVVKGVDSDDVGKKAQLQLKRVKSLFGSKVIDHMVLVLDYSTNVKVNDKMFKNIELNLVIHKTHGNDEEFKTNLYTSIDQLLNTSNYTGNKWYGGGPFLTVNRLLHSAVSTDLEEEVREHIRQNGYNVFTPTPDERKKKKGKRRSKTRARRTVTRGKVVKSSKKKPKRGSSRPNAHDMEQSAASIETGKLTSGKGKGGMLDEPTKGVSHVHRVAENDCDQGTTKQPTSHGNKVESIYTSGSLSCEEVVEVGEEVSVIRASRVVTEKSGSDTTADPSQSPAGTMKQEGEDHNVVQSSTWFKFDFDQKGVIATNEPPDIRRDPAIEEEQQNKPNQNIKEEGNRINKSSKVPFDIIDLTGDEPDSKCSEKEKPCKRTYGITGKENGSPRKVQRKQDYCCPSALSIIKTMR